MYVNPREFRGVFISCRQCWQCKETRVDGVVGRCIAEMQTSGATYCVTLTYGGDDRITGEVPLRARLLDYGDVSGYLKRLRKTVPVRYVAAGEYGDRRGRGHWHLIQFMPREFPGIELDRRFNHHTWPHGFMYWEAAIYEKMRYACSYVLKNADARQNAERRYGASRFPPLGREYFRQLALKHVEQYLSPQDCFYMFQDIKKADGSLKRFLLTRRSAELYKEDFINAWASVHGNLNWPQSDMIDEHLDKICRDRSIRPGDWLEERRWKMNQMFKRAQWRGGNVDAVANIGRRADREIRALHPDRLDDRLRVMGNRKGIGYVPQPTPTSPQPTMRGFRTPFHPAVERSLGAFAPFHRS